MTNTAEYSSIIIKNSAIFCARFQFITNLTECTPLEFCDVHGQDYFSIITELVLLARKRRVVDRID